VIGVLNLCTACVHYLDDGTCNAFPAGIPDDILLDLGDHHVARKGDRGIQFHPMVGRESIVESWERARQLAATDRGASVATMYTKAWDESLHQRDYHGRFTSTGGGGSSSGGESGKDETAASDEALRSRVRVPLRPTDHTQGYAASRLTPEQDRITSAISSVADEASRSTGQPEERAMKAKVIDDLDHRIGKDHFNDLVRIAIPTNPSPESALDHEHLWESTGSLDQGDYGRYRPLLSDDHKEHARGLAAGTYRYGDDPKLHELLRKEGISRVVQQWAATSNDSSVHSLAIQEVAKDEFGLETTLSWDDVSPTHRMSGTVAHEVARNGGAYRAFLRAQYDQTQDLLAKNNVKTITLYRGMKSAVTHNWGYGETPPHLRDLTTPAKDVKLRPLSSWTFKERTAMKFAELTTSDGMDFGDVTPTSARLVSWMQRARVPASRILSCPATGVGCLNEAECVVLGGPATVRSDLLETMGYHVPETDTGNDYTDDGTEDDTEDEADPTSYATGPQAKPEGYGVDMGIQYLPPGVVPERPPVAKPEPGPNQLQLPISEHGASS